MEVSRMALPNPALAGRNGRIWRDWCRGASQDALAERYGVSQPRISQIVNEIREGITEDERADLVKQETDLLRMLRDEVLADVYDADPAPLIAGKDGAIVRDENGNVVKDHSGRLAGLAAAEKLTARLHRVLGLDAPQKVDIGLNGEADAAKKAAGEALSYLHGGGDDA
jgi:hypothetical protein